MSGHSKWKTIQHKKGAMDAKRGQLFSKLSKELMVVAKRGGGNPDTNPALRAVIQKARSANMPMENIMRAIKKGTGELEGATAFEEVVYEGYAPGGVAAIVVALTDNKNRTAAEIRHVFTRHKANMAAQGAVLRNFERKGQIFVDASTVDEDKLLDIVLNAGAEDMRRDGDNFEILTQPSAFSEVVEALNKAGIKPVSAEIALVPLSYVTISDKATASATMSFISELEDMDDVQNVYTNMDIPDEILNSLNK
jgi:YebC/PmpR family DNA-binding regulatory protein